MLNRIVNGFAFLSGVLLCTLTCLICVDVLTRNVPWLSFGFSMGWTLEVAEYHLYLITFFAAPWVLRIGGHIAVDLLVQNLSDAVARQLARLSYLIGAIVCTVLLVYACKVLWASFSAGTLVYKALVIPEWPLFVPAPITFVLMLLIFLRWLQAPPAQTALDTDGL